MRKRLKLQYKHELTIHHSTHQCDDQGSGVTTRELRSQDTDVSLADFSVGLNFLFAEEQDAPVELCRLFMAVGVLAISMIDLVSCRERATTLVSVLGNSCIRSSTLLHRLLLPLELLALSFSGRTSVSFRERIACSEVVACSKGAGSAGCSLGSSHALVSGVDSSVNFSVT